MTAAGLSKAEIEEILGWYYIAPDGKYYDIGAYTSIRLEKDITVTPFTKTSTFYVPRYAEGAINAPLYTTGEVGSSVPVDAWQGGFTLGFADRDNVLGSFTLFDEVRINSTTDCFLRYASEWTQGGLYLYSSNVGFIQPNLESSTNKYTVLAWDALVSGTVDITLDIPAADTVSLIVVKNGTIIYPSATTVSADDRSTWYAKTGSTAVNDLLVADEMSVTAGDQIRFIMARSESGDTTSAVWPTITYTNDLSKPTFSDEIVYGGTTSFVDNKPTLDTVNETVTFNGGWDFVYYNGISDIAGQKPRLLDTFSNVDTVRSNLSLSENSQTNYSGIGGGVYFGSRGELTFENQAFSVMVCTSHVAGYRYTAERAGTIRFDFTKLGRFSTQGSANAVISYAVYVDGVKVWPVSTNEQNGAINTNGWYSYVPVASQNNDHTAAANALDADSRAGITVSKGSTVEFLCSNSSSSIWGGSGNLLYADITYEKAADFATSFNTNKPTYDKTNDIVTWNGGWSLVHYNNVAAIADGNADFLTKGMRINNDRDALTIPANAGSSSNSPSTILATAGISASNWSYGSYTYNISAAKGHVGGYRYTAETTGFIDIDFTKLGHFCDMASSDTMVYAIYVDGQKIWPTGDNWYGRAGGTGTIDVTEAANATDEAARRNIFVRRGSHVEFLCTSTDTSKTIWGTAGNLMYADIVMHEIDPKITVAGTVGSAFAMNLTVGNRASYKNITVKLNGESVTADHGIYTLALAAKEMNTPITYEVTGEIFDQPVTLAKGETTFADYLTALVENETVDDSVRMLAQATLQYGAAAEKYFASGSLSAEEQAMIQSAPATTGELNVIKNADQSANQFAFEGVSLLLNDEIDLKLYINALAAQESLAAYTIRVESEKVTGNGWTLAARNGADGTLNFKTIISGIPAVAYGSDLKITVMEGETAVSDTLVYSVDAYVSRMYGSSTDNEKNLLHAITKLGDAAGGAHIHIYGDWYLDGGNADNQLLESRVCSLCGHVYTRILEDVSISYQDTYTFASPILSIENESVYSTDVLSGELDAHVLIKSAENEVYATGTGSALVHTADGYYNVIVNAATINMLFLTGQSNAEGASAAGAVPDENNKYDYADYGKYFLRSPDRMAYYTYTYHGLDITAEESTGRTPESFVVKSLKWGDNTRYSSVVSNGPSVTTLCDESSTFSSTGVGAALTAEWIKQTGERVWLVNAAHGGHPIQNFLPLGSEGVGDVPEARYNDYEQAVAVFRLALQTLENEIKAGHFTLNRMAFYWFQGESDSSSNDLYYLEQFDRMYSHMQQDVQIDGKSFDFGGLFTLRSCKDNSGNSEAELYMTGPRIAQYEIGADNSGEDNSYSNVYVVTNATERWATTDEAVKEYFLEVYGSEENFKAIFGYDMPTTRAMLHPNIHYAVYGQAEMGIDAARNTLMILAEQNEWDETLKGLDYVDLKKETTIRLVSVDGYTKLTEIAIDVSKNIGYVIPQVTPIYRVARGLTLVSETEGYVFDQFRVGVDKSYEGTLAEEITFSIYLGSEWLQRYTMPIKVVSSISLDSDVTYAQYGGDLAENPARETKIYSEGSWNRGWIDYKDGSLHLFDYYNTENGWYYTTGDVLWGNPFHGAYSSQGLALSGAAGSGAAIYWEAGIDGVVTPYFDVLNTNLGDVNMAIMVNGYIAWPETAARLNYDEHSGWYHAYNGDTEGETETTAAMINAALADCRIQVKAGDEIAFVFERVSSVCNMTVMPGLQYLTGDVEDAVTVPGTPYSAPVETVAFNSSHYSSTTDAETGVKTLVNSSPFDFGYLTYSTNTFTPFTVIDGNGWLHEQGEELWSGANWHGAFWFSSYHGIAVSHKTGEDIAIRYTVEKAGTVVPQVASLTHGNGSTGNMYLAVFIKRAGESVYTPVLPGASAGADGSGWYPVIGKEEEGVSLTTAAELNVLLDDAYIDVNEGDEILFLFANNGTAQNTGMRLYPSIVYTAVKE